MSYSPQQLMQMYLEGTLSPEAQGEFDHLFKKDPQFAEGVIRALGQNLGEPPEEWLKEIAAKLEARKADLWNSYRASNAESVLRMVQWLFVGAVCIVLLVGWEWVTREAPARVSSVPALESPESEGSDAPSAPRTAIHPLGPKRKVFHSVIKKHSAPLRTPVPLHETVKLLSVQVPVAPQAASSAVRAKETAPASTSGGTANPGLSWVPLSAKGVPEVAPPSQQVAPAPAPQGTGAGVAGKQASNLSSDMVSTQAGAGNKIRVVIDTLNTDHVKIKVIDAIGGLIQNLYEGPWSPGRYVDWNGEDMSGEKVPQGDYYVVIQTATKTISNKVTLKSNQ